MLLGWLNRADDALISTDSELDALPASNVQHAHVARAWHTVAGIRTAYLIFDMVTATACQLLGVMGSNLTASATLRVRASNSDATVTSSLQLDTGTLTSTAKTGYGQSYHDFTSATARYWRIDFADSTVAENLQIGRVFLGPRWAPSVNQEFGWSTRAQDSSVVQKSYGGQKFSEVRPQQRVLKFGLSFMDEAEMYGNAFALARELGVVGDVLAVHDTLGGAYIAEQSVFGSLVDVQDLVHENYGIFRNKFTIEETL